MPGQPVRRARAHDSRRIGTLVDRLAQVSNQLADIATGALAVARRSERPDKVLRLTPLTEGFLPRHTPHLESNLWLVGQFGARVAVDGGRVEIQGLALSR